MKNLLYLLLFIPLVGFGQNINLTAKDYYEKAYNNKSDWQYQLDNYTNAIRIDPDFTGAYFNRGNVYAQLERYNDAIDDFTKVIRSAPDYAPAFYSRGYVYDQLERYNDAIDDYTKAIRIDPDYLKPYSRRAGIYVKLERYNSAKYDYTQVIRIDPDNAYAYKHRGSIKYHLGLSSCSDYKRACNLGIEICCEWYKEDNCSK